MHLNLMRMMIDNDAMFCFYLIYIDYIISLKQFSKSNDRR